MRIVSLTDHPSNIVVFTAANMSDALAIASDAFVQDSIQGMVWAAAPVPLQWHSEFTLSSAFRTAINATRAEGRFDTVVNSVITQDNRQEIGFGYNGQNRIPPGVLEPVREHNLSVLSFAFGHAQLAIRHEVAGKINPHLDGANKPYKTEPDDRLFSGQNMRILCTRQGEGTIVYSQATGGDVSAPDDGWSVGLGNYLFLTGLNGIRGKALLHSTPQFTTTKENPRVVDVYDCLYS